jgi:hypothetical protein
VEINTTGQTFIRDWIAIGETGGKAIEVTIFTPKIKLLKDILY